MTKDEVLKMAIEALEFIKDGGFYTGEDDCIQACKEALEQPAQEPVAWMSGGGVLTKLKSEAQLWITKGGTAIPLYTHPASPAQEPVAWTSTKALQNAKLLGAGDLWLEFDENYAMDAKEIGSKSKQIPLYTHPAPSWQGLSDDKKLAIMRKWKDAHTMREQELIGLGDAFEQALRIKNAL